MSYQLLYRIDPHQNMARFYRVEILSDLFDDIIVERRWGRIGGRGQVRHICYPSMSLAEDAAAELIQAKVRRGYRAAA